MFISIWDVVVNRALQLKLPSLQIFKNTIIDAH